MKEKLMTIERWADPSVKAEFYSRFTDILKKDNKRHEEQKEAQEKK
jgi:hypothetical protein